jgi:hypothetical protein
MRKALISLIGFAVFVAACGSSDTRSTQSEDDTATETTTVDSPATTAAASSSGSSSSSSYCARVVVIEEVIDEIESRELTFGDEMGAMFREVLDLQVDALGIAPDEIADSAAIIADGLTTFKTILEPVDYDIFALTEEQQELLDSPEFDNAQDILDQYHEDVCRVEDDSSADEDTPRFSSDDIDSLLNSSQREEVLGPIMAAGIDEATAECTVRALFGAGIGFDLSDNANLDQLVDVMTGCGITLTQLAELGVQDSGEVFDPNAMLEGLRFVFTPEFINALRDNENARNSMAQGLVASGLDAAKAPCVVAAIAEAGPSALDDLDTFINLFLDCGLSISELSALG